MNNYKLKYFLFNSNCLLINWPEEIDEKINNDVNDFKNVIESNFNNISEVRSSYCSLLLIFEKKIKNIVKLENKLDELYDSKEILDKKDRFLWHIPVCYDKTYALDIDFVATQNKIHTEEIIEKHCQQIYTVYLIGFLPGFLYLGSLDKMLHIPRKKEPRLRVPKGAVAIANEQTGIYPQESPGGWNVLGNTPICLFDKSKNNPCFAKPGDKIQFFQITKDDYKEIEKQVGLGDYRINKKTIND